VKLSLIKSQIEKTVDNWNYDFQERIHSESDLKAQESLLIAAYNLIRTYDELRAATGLKVVYERIDGGITKRVIPWNAGTECNTTTQRGE
jgi:hypothetical protein